MSSKTTTTDRATTDPAVVPVVREELEVGQETLQTGRVEVRIEQRLARSQVELEASAERVEVVRVPVGREVECTQPPHQEGDDWVVPVYEEVVRIERRLVLKEEIRLRRQRETRRWQEEVVLTRDEPVIHRASAATDDEHAAGTDEADLREP